MCCQPTPLFRCLFCVLLLALPATSRAQPALPAHDIDLEGSDVKEVARAAFEASQAAPRDLARARLQAAQTELRVRYEKYRAGAQDATLDSLLESAARLTEAELAALDKPTPADRLAPLATYWLYTLSAEQIVKSKYRVGRVSLVDWMQARHARLDAEIKLKDVGRKLSAPFLPPSPFSDEAEPFAYLDAKVVAQSAFEAAQADRRSLAAARRDAAQTGYLELLAFHRMGEADLRLDLLVKAAHQWLDAELALSETAAERLAAHERYCGQLQTTEEDMRRRYEMGRIGPADYAQVRSQRLAAEMRLREARDKVKEK